MRQASALHWPASTAWNLTTKRGVICLQYMPSKTQHTYQPRQLPTAPHPFSPSTSAPSAADGTGNHGLKTAAIADRARLGPSTHCRPTTLPAAAATKLKPGVLTILTVQAPKHGTHINLDRWPAAAHPLTPRPLAPPAASGACLCHLSPAAAAAAALPPAAPLRPVPLPVAAAPATERGVLTVLEAPAGVALPVVPAGTAALLLLVRACRKREECTYVLNVEYLGQYPDLARLAGGRQSSPRFRQHEGERVHA
jgi:hypothetical protein